jgi:hypothetical protein
MLATFRGYSPSETSSRGKLLQVMLRFDRFDVLYRLLLVSALQLTAQPHVLQRVLRPVLCAFLCQLIVSEP